MEEFQNSENINNDQTASPKIRGRSIILALFLNLLAPGLGVYYTGRFLQGILIGLCWPVLVGVSFSILLSFLTTFESIIFCFFLSSLYAGIIAYTVYIAHKNEKNYRVKKWNHPVFYVIFFVFFTIYAKPFIKASVEAYRIPIGTMENTLLVEDLILVRKNAYGIILPFTNTKIINLKSPERNDVVIYFPDDKEKVLYTKRIIGIPGDTIEITDKIVFINGDKEKPNKHFTYDKVKREKGFMNPRIYPKGENWNEDNYGPLYIPKKGDIIRLDSLNVNKWSELIAKDSDNSDLGFPMRLLTVKEYEIKNNYFFMLGDNRNYSLDSRFTGLVPERDIIGKAALIYFNKNDFSRIGTNIK